MYDDVEACHECGSEVRLEPREVVSSDASGPVGPVDGVVGGGDPTVDRRVCSNSECPTNGPGSDAPGA